jgi:hypothetical protein
MSSWHSYPKVYNLGHSAVKDLLDGRVVVQEKVDGSQFSFGVFDGVLRVRSKGKEFPVDAPEKMFTAAVETAKRLAPYLKDGWTYRGEYLQKAKHNTLAYYAPPPGHIILFDIAVGEERYLHYEDLAEEANRLGLWTVPVLYVGEGRDLSATHLERWLDRVSELGGAKIEGVVIKNYARFGPDGKALFGKHVSESFRELHRGEWKNTSPAQGDVIQALIHTLRTPARWEKAVQHLREAGVITDSPKDIGAVINEVKRDTISEEREMIQDRLMKYALPKIERGVVAGVAEWYKQKLMEKQFEEDAA